MRFKHLTVRFLIRFYLLHSAWFISCLLNFGWVFLGFFVEIIDAVQDLCFEYFGFVESDLGAVARVQDWQCLGQGFIFRRSLAFRFLMTVSFGFCFRLTICNLLLVGRPIDVLIEPTRFIASCVERKRFYFFAFWLLVFALLFSRVIRLIL